MNLHNKRCPKCGEKKFKRINVKGTAHGVFVWKDFPKVFLSQDLNLWVCTNCGNQAMVKGDAQRLDKAIEASIREQVAQLIQIILDKSGLTLREVHRRTGISYQYLSNLKNKRRTPSFEKFNNLRLISTNPKSMLEILDPDRDFRMEDLLVGEMDPLQK
jgi:ribosomal protein L37AE/L43A